AGDAGDVDDLQPVAGRIDQIERGRAVAMQPRLAEDLDLELGGPLAQARVPGLDRERVGDHEAEVIEGRVSALDLADPMEREVVTAAGQVRRVDVGLPVYLHAHALAIEP